MADMRLAIEGLERRVGKNERDIQIAINAIRSLLTPSNPSIPKKRMGFSGPEPSIREKLDKCYFFLIPRIFRNL
jgi:hypothetical protein